MCTALTLKTSDGNHLFGRNMDIEYHFNQNILLIPRHYKWKQTLSGKVDECGYAVIGMGTVIMGHPMMADGMNEKGLACAGLNFPGYASYDTEAKEGWEAVGPYDFMMWLLRQFETIEQVKEALGKMQLVNIPFGEGIPLVPLHWMVTDLTGKSIVIEKTKEGLQVHDNKVGVLSNAPDFGWHLTNLRHYMGIQTTQPVNTKWDELELTPLGQGMGMYGIPGDFAPASRFVRTAFLKSHHATCETVEKGLAAFYRILGNVAMVSGSVVTPDGKNDITTYTSCMHQEEGVYYYTTYESLQLKAIQMKKEDLTASEITVFPYSETLKIDYCN